MAGRTIIVETDGDVVIDLAGLRGSSKQRSDTSDPAAPLASDVAGDSGGSGPNAAIRISRRLRELMELRSESSFRPRQEDFEIIYGLSGNTEMTPDTLHRLASHRAVQEADPDEILFAVNGIVEEIREERSGDAPKVLVIAHTHPAPGNVPEPSSADRSFFKNTAQRFRSAFPGVRVFFAVHAISRESIRKREPASQPRPNLIRWTSITREHEVGFFDEDSVRFEVESNG